MSETEDKYVGPNVPLDDLLPPGTLEELRKVTGRTFRIVGYDSETKTLRLKEDADVIDDDEEFLLSLFRWIFWAAVVGFLFVLAVAVFG